MMKQDVVPSGAGEGLAERLSSYGFNFPRRAVIGLILVVALFAFEMFNFDTTRYALDNLLGPIKFAGLGWATILAVAFCAIDFAGLVRLFTPDSDGEQPKEVWYLMGAWLLGATMNALMTWWAVSLTLLNHDFGNEVLGREQLLQIVPIFVAALVWLTRILFIGALTVAGEHLLEFGIERKQARPMPRRAPLRERRPAAVAASAHRAASSRPSTPQPTVVSRARSAISASPEPANASPARHEPVEAPTPHLAPSLRKIEDDPAQPSRDVSRSKPNGRVRQRPPMPGVSRRGMSASSRHRS